MTAWGYRLMHLANLSVGFTGVVYAWMLYGMTPSPEGYSVVNHPWQSHVQHAHVLVAPLLIFAIGSFWWGHALTYRQRGIREGRRTGIMMIYTATPMILSGYALQTSVSEGWRNVWVVVHVTASLLWLGCFTGHWLVHRLQPASSTR